MSLTAQRLLCNLQLDLAKIIPAGPEKKLVADLNDLEQ